MKRAKLVERSVMLCIMTAFMICIAYIVHHRSVLLYHEDTGSDQGNKTLTLITHQAFVRPLSQILKRYSKRHNVQVILRVADVRKLHSILTRKTKYADTPIIIWPEGDCLQSDSGLTLSKLWWGEIVAVVSGQANCFTRKCKHISDLASLVYLMKDVNTSDIAILNHVDIVKYHLLHSYEELMIPFCNNLYHKYSLDQFNKNFCTLDTGVGSSIGIVHMKHRYAATLLHACKQLIYRDAELCICNKALDNIDFNQDNLKDFSRVLKLHETGVVHISFENLSHATGVHLLRKRCLDTMLSNRRWMHNLLAYRIQDLQGELNSRAWKVLFALASDIEHIGVRLLPRFGIKYNTIIAYESAKNSKHNQLVEFLLQPDSEIQDLLAQHGLYPNSDAVPRYLP